MKTNATQRHGSVCQAQVQAGSDRAWRFSNTFRPSFAPLELIIFSPRAEPEINTKVVALTSLLVRSFIHETERLVVGQLFGKANRKVNELGPREERRERSEDGWLAVKPE